MSLKHTESITCSKCGKESGFTAWRSLNTVLDPDEKIKVLNGELFRFTCPDCGYKAFVNYPHLYHAMDEEVIIYYLPDKNEDEIQEAINAFQFQDDFTKGCPENYKKRIVFALADLIEKANIFNAGLDDKIIELMKIFYYVQIKDKNVTDKIAVIRFFVDDNGEMMFLFNSEEEMICTARFSRDMYDILSDRYGTLLQKHSEGNFFIDFNWAYEIVKSDK